MAVSGTSSGTVPERRRVLIPLPLAGPYDYRLPATLSAEPGDFVRVPLGSRAVIGVVWSVGGGNLPESRLKEIAERLDHPPLPADVRALVDWVADYTLSPPGAVLRMAMSVPGALEPPRLVLRFRPGPAAPPRLTAARRRVLTTAA
ncbi:MAG: primosomal protein N', partial [Alphaproteobacteria bacterium]|nr:primosomal protein N' [Alphaproteobacteria bacterium]